MINDKGAAMKRRNMISAILVSLAMFVFVSSQVWAQNYGQVRALNRRAVTVTRQKNDFVARVLHSYGIPCQVTQEGVVARLQIEKRWYDVKQIEIVPVIQEVEGGYLVTAHEIFFYTEGEILHLVSAAKIR